MIDTKEVMNEQDRLARQTIIAGSTGVGHEIDATTADRLSRYDARHNLAPTEKSASLRNKVLAGLGVAALAVGVAARHDIGMELNAMTSAAATDPAAPLVMHTNEVDRAHVASQQGQPPQPLVDASPNN
jgi:hypothetical protein